MSIYFLRYAAFAEHIMQVKRSSFALGLQFFLRMMKILLPSRSVNIW